MDWAGIVPAVAAAVQIAAVVVQVYWDRRQHTASMTPHPDGACCPVCAEDLVTVTAGVAVQVGTVASVRTSSSVAVIVRVGEGGELLPRVKEHGPW
ncbi:hypothetical protein [Streptomyces wedmorensis]